MRRALNLMVDRRISPLVSGGEESEFDFEAAGERLRVLEQRAARQRRRNARVLGVLKFGVVGLLGLGGAAAITAASPAIGASGTSTDPGLCSSINPVTPCCWCRQCNSSSRPVPRGNAPLSPPSTIPSMTATVRTDTAQVQAGTAPVQTGPHAPKTVTSSNGETWPNVVQPAHATAAFDRPRSFHAVPACLEPIRAAASSLLASTRTAAFRVFGDPSVGPYDGGDDTLVGVQNNSSTPVSAITVSGPGSDLSGFDGDGLCTYGVAGCPFGPTGYEGQGTSFVVDPSLPDSAEIDFAAGIGATKSAYFSLEGALTSAVLTAREGHLSNRYVALGDSVPYGHGLVDPYPYPRPGLDQNSVSQAPASNAYPGLISSDLHLAMSIRPTNCNLVGDDLAFSGAPASVNNAGSGNDQCSNFGTSVVVESDELPAAHFHDQPARLVTIQAGADDINFSGCLEREILKIPVIGKECVSHGNVTSGVAQELANLQGALISMIQTIAPHAQEVAVLNYYQIVPNPKNFVRSSVRPSSGTLDLVCDLMAPTLSNIYSSAVIIQSALNSAIAKAVTQAELDGVKNVKLIDLTDLEQGHEMCTGKPAVFSGNPINAARAAQDLALLTGVFSQSAVNDLKAYIWRTGHPNSFGQRDIANAVEQQLGSSLSP